MRPAYCFLGGVDLPGFAGVAGLAGVADFDGFGLAAGGGAGA